MRDFFGNGYNCPQGVRGVYRGVAREGAGGTLLCALLLTDSTGFFLIFSSTSIFGEVWFENQLVIGFFSPFGNVSPA